MNPSRWTRRRFADCYERPASAPASVTATPAPQGPSVAPAPRRNARCRGLEAGETCRGYVPSGDELCLGCQAEEKRRNALRNATRDMLAIDEVAS